MSDISELKSVLRRLGFTPEDTHTFWELLIDDILIEVMLLNSNRVRIDIFKNDKYNLIERVYFLDDIDSAILMLVKHTGRITNLI